MEGLPSRTGVAGNGRVWTHVSQVQRPGKKRLDHGWPRVEFLPLNFRNGCQGAIKLRGGLADQGLRVGNVRKIADANNSRCALGIGVKRETQQSNDDKRNGPEFHVSPSKLVSDVELQTLQKIFSRTGARRGDERAPEEADEVQLHVLKRLIKNLDAVLADVGTLPHFAVVEDAQHGFAVYEHPGIREKPIALLLLASNATFEPVRAAPVRIAGGVRGLRECGRRCIRGGGENISNVRTCLRVLNIIAEENKRPALRGHLDVKPCDVVEQTELRGELRVRDYFLPGGGEGFGGGDGRILIGVALQFQEPKLRTGGVSSGNRQGNRVGIVPVVKRGVSAELEPVRELPYRLDLAAVDNTLNRALVTARRDDEVDAGRFGKRELESDKSEVLETREILKVPRELLADTLRI